jgi:uncharacterized protein YaiE (UPF0345 family)
MPQYQGVWNLAQQAQALTSQRWVTDPLFRNTTLLLQADNAAGGAQNNTFLDSSSNAFAITRNGGNPGMTQGSFSPFSATGWSNFCQTAGTDYINCGSQAAYAFGTGKYTIEFFVYPTAAGGSDAVFASIETVSTGWYISRNLNAGVALNARGTGAVITTNSYQIPLNQWTHVVITRNSTAANDTRIFVNGVLAVAGTDANNWSATGNLFLMNTGVAGYNAAGYISNVRLIKGSIPTSYQTASTTSGTVVFIPPSAALTTTSQGATSTDVSLLTCQSNRFADNSGTPKTITLVGTPYVQAFSPFAPQYQYTPTITGSSGYFDGTGDYLSAAANAAFNFSTGNFTVEFWYYPLSISSSRTILDINYATAPNCTVQPNGGTMIFYYNGSSTITASQSDVVGTWSHYAIVRNGTTITMYRNGVSVGSATYSGNVGSSSVLCKISSDSFPMQGYLANFRIVKGVAVYTGAFSAPIALLSTSGSASASAYSSTTNVNTTFDASSCSLLLNFTNAGILDGTMKNNLETVGNAQVSTSVVKYGSGSIFLDGTGDWLSMPMSGAFSIPANSPFTVEGWFYLTAAQANYRMLFSDNATAPTYFTVTSTGLEAQFGGVPGTIASCSFNFVTGTWYHIALVRNDANRISIYVNGVAQTITNPTQSAAFLYQGTTLWVGRFGTATTYEYNGYMDDLRVTKGIARYTRNFTPPQVALPRQ